MPSAIAIWIWVCAYLNCAGWALSGLHQLNYGGYVIALAIGAAWGGWWLKTAGRAPFAALAASRLRRRFRRCFPLAFLILAVLAFAGGALYAPSNYDALAYRTPRVLNWLADGHWHWIHSDFPRLNTRTAGFEWLTAPQFLFFHTDRLVFLLNFISFLLLPGRVFAVLTRLGVKPRAAWHWMWLFPAGYGYVLEAGSILNDMFAGLMAMTALEFALRARVSSKADDVWVSGLAAGLMTAVKAFNLVLLLPWLIAIFPGLKSLLRRPFASAIVLTLALTASMLPTACLNYRQCGDWTGLKVEQATIGGGGKPQRFLANALNIPAHNLVPPVFPFTRQWEKLVFNVIPPKLEADMQSHMELGLATVRLPEMQAEEFSGLGCGVTLLLLALLLKKIRARENPLKNVFSVTTLVPLGAWAGLGVLMMQTGASGPARYLLPFYLLLAAPIMAGPVAGNIFRSKIWRGAAMAVFASSLLLLIISPARPLWPAQTVLRNLGAERSGSPWLQRAWNVYSTYHTRTDGFAPVIAALPPDANPLGFMAFDEPETALWKPFGSRRILNFCHADTAADLKARGIRYALVSERYLENHHQQTGGEWLQQAQVTLVRRFELKLLASQPAQGWLLVRVP
jgi:hypothetical protein